MSGTWIHFRRGKISPPPALPLPRVQFAFIILSTRGEPIAEQEFTHELLMNERARRLSREARALLRRDCLRLSCERRRFAEGRALREPPIFRLCRQLSNIGQINMAPSDHDLITIGRSAFCLEYDGPPAHGQAQLELMVHGAEVVRSLRPGLVVDREARQIWGAHSWEAQLARHHGLGAREHFKIEMSQLPGGIRLSTRGLAKFGLPDLRMEALPHDLSGIGAISMTSIALDLVHADGPLDPGRLLDAPVVRGHFRFAYEKQRGDDYPAGAFRLSGGVDGEEPTPFGLLEILSRLRRRYVDGESFQEISAPDADAIRRAQEALPRFKEKFFAARAAGERVFLAQRAADGSGGAGGWMVVSSLQGSTLRGKSAAHEEPPAEIAFDQAEIIDWVILRHGDVEDGGFQREKM